MNSVNDIILKGTGLRRYFPLKQAATLTAKSASKSPPAKWLKAVDDVDIEIRAGETVAIVGESGSGKTTLSRLLLLLNNPDAGQIEFKGKNTTEFNKGSLRDFRKAIQPVFQNPFSALNPRMRVGQIIAEPLKILEATSGSETEKRVAEVLTKVGLKADDGKKFPHQFSGGQRQRIAIARALISRPELIVLDEPIASQDISIQAQILNLLKDLQEQEGVSYLFIAHDLATVKFLSDRIYVMYFGRVVEQAKTEDLFANPLHPYTQNLLASHLPDHPKFRAQLFGGNLAEGEVPNPSHPPTGCAFQTRCQYVESRCLETPTLTALDDRQVACVRYPLQFSSEIKTG